MYYTALRHSVDFDAVYSQVIIVGVWRYVGFQGNVVVWTQSVQLYSCITNETIIGAGKGADAGESVGIVWVAHGSQFMSVIIIRNIRVEPDEQVQWIIGKQGTVNSGKGYVLRR
jgi:hypothetical protein